MFSVRVKGADSWLDPESAAILGWKLDKRLKARCEGQEGRFITLTYDPKRWGSAQECFDRARAEKHVSRFMRKLAVLLGVDLKGKWLCKMEFQQSGFVHWHILLLGVGFINPVQFRQIYDLWGKGSINVKPLTEENIKYLTKYVAKDGSVPGWVYGYPARSIKVVRPSQGFWGDEQAAKAREKTAKRKQEQEEKEAEEFYVPIGEKIRIEKTLLRVDGKAFSVAAPRHRVLGALREYFGRPCGEEGSWLHYEGSLAKLQAVLARLVGRAETNAPKRPSGKGASERIGEGPGPLFLRGTGKRVGWWKVRWLGKWFTLSPDDLAGEWSSWWAEHAPWWLKLAWEQEARYELGMDMHGNWGWPRDAVVRDDEGRVVCCV
jgi:hypothetical protein